MTNKSLDMRDPSANLKEGGAAVEDAAEPGSLFLGPWGRAEAVEFDPPAEWMARAGRRNSREKCAAGLRGLKYAIRGDSSFFAHAYRGILIALTAALLGIGPAGWCLLVISACMVLMSELTHSAIDTLARALGDPEDPPVRIAREIGTGVVLVATFGSGAVTITVLTLKFGELLGWWP